MRTGITVHTHIIGPAPGPGEPRRCHIVVHLTTTVSHRRGCAAPMTGRLRTWIALAGISGPAGHTRYAHFCSGCVTQPARCGIEPVITGTPSHRAGCGDPTFAAGGIRR